MRAMRSLTRDQFLTILGMSSPTFDALQRDGHVALAFGTPIPATPGRYLDLDLVGMAMATVLAPTFGRDGATWIVLGFFNQWVAAVGEADVNPSRNYFVAMGSFGGDVIKRKPDEIRITHGTDEQVLSDLQGAHSVMKIDITYLLARLRINARVVGIDLEPPFFFSPEHERYSQIITEFKQQREHRVARLRRDRQKSRRRQAMEREQGTLFKVAQRLKDQSTSPDMAMQ
jgi:hypothetical protein